MFINLLSVLVAVIVVWLFGTGAVLYMLRDALKSQDIVRQLDGVNHQTVLYRVKLLAKEGYIGVFNAHQRLICYSMGAE
jgi:uncharacterized membrane protein YiaA